MRQIFLFSVLLSALVACSREEQQLQRIDQVLNIYVKDQSGKDLLNSKLAGSYQQVLLKDLGGIRDQITISVFTFRKDPKNITYLEYAAGATRNLKDSLNPDFKTYRSDVMLELRKKAADSVDLDTLVMFYKWTPEIFRLKSVNYNGRKVFEKVEGQPNTITIVK